MILNSPLHHEEHEDFLCRCMILRDHLQDESLFGNNPMFFFAAFVLFVVQQEFSG